MSEIWGFKTVRTLTEDTPDCSEFKSIEFVRCELGRRIDGKKGLQPCRREGHWALFHNNQVTVVCRQCYRDIEARLKKDIKCRIEDLREFSTLTNALASQLVLEKVEINGPTHEDFVERARELLGLMHENENEIEQKISPEENNAIS